MKAAESICSGCNKTFTRHGLSQHIAKTHRVRCRAVHAATQPRSRFQSFPYERAPLTLTQNSTSWGHPDPFFGSEHPSGHDGTRSDSPPFPSLGNESVTTGDMDDRKLALHRSGPYTKPPTAMTIDHASNSADDRANDTAGGDGMPDTTDGDGLPDTTDATDASVFEILTQNQTSRFLDPDSTAPDPEQIPSAESESPPDDPPNPLEPSSADAHPQVVVEHFPCGSPGAPINSMQGSSIYESSQEALGGSVWAPFQSECDWDVAHWAKMNGPSSSALTGLLAIPNVRLFFFFSLLQC